MCDEPLPVNNEGVCTECAKKIKYIRDPFCLKCGKPLTDERELCNDCANKKHEFIQGTAVFDYGSVAQSLHRFKNKGRSEYAKTYARIMYEQRKEWLMNIKPDALIPVPIHKSKLRDRGYNQAELIAEELGKLSGIPVYPNLIKRCKKTLPLKFLSPKERQNNLKNAFKLCLNDVKLTTIVIIDDVYTTGSTIDEIAETILGQLPCRIYFMTLTIGRGV